MSAQPELYRKPFQPGYLGSYNWPAMALGCILFLLTNWASTEYIAMRFEYQPALGSPLFQVGHTPVYPPFAWFLWGLHNITSHDPAVRQPLGEGIVILFFGCAVSIFLYFGANSLRSRRLSANAEHLHGSARWATDDDIRETGLLDASQGVYVGGLETEPVVSVALPAARWSRTRPGVCSDTFRQGRQPGDPYAIGMERERNHLRHKRRELGDDRRFSLTARAHLLPVLSGGGILRITVQSAR
jgi:hypothetical protein